MKRVLVIAVLLLFLLPGCRNTTPQAQIVATTAPLYEFTKALCEGTDIRVAQLITENVSCLHDYTLQSGQMHLIESADLVILSGFGLEDFLDDPIKSAKLVSDASAGIEPIYRDPHDHSEHNHSHETDPHIWLSPENAAKMADNIYDTLLSNYPKQKDTFYANYRILSGKFAELSKYAEDHLATLACRDLITFHDGFSYMAEAFDLHILHAIEEESGSEASAAELISICQLIKEKQIPAIFTETNGSDSAANIIAKETGVPVYTLNMAMSETGYFEAMYHNINTLKEALE